MKKNLFLVLLILLIGCLAFVGCDVTTKEISTIEIKSTSETGDILTYEIGAFNYDDYSIYITYVDNTTETIPLTESMISEYDRLQLTYKGSHKVTVNYNDYTLYINVKIIEKSIELEDEDKTPRLGSTTFTYLNNAYHCTYDGEYHSLDVLGDLPEGSTVTFPIGNSFKNAGTYNVNAVISANDYETISLWSTLVIDKAEYDLSTCSLYVDYGTDVNKEPLTSFTYDGESHEAVLRGTYPEGLTFEYLIGSQTEDLDTYVEGNSAIDAGDYFVVAKFTGDSANYETLDEYGDYKLYVYTPLIIKKKSYSEDFTKNIVFEDKTVTYDGKEHRITLSGVTLPEGIRVEYQDANGNIFGSRTDANEEGYLVIAKFINDNEKNYEIVSDVKARLYIKKASYDTTNFNVSFGDGVESLDYDTNFHEVIIEGVPAGATIKSASCDGKEVTSLVNAGTYNIKVEFEPADKNHKDIPTYEKTLTINKINFETIDVQFESRTYVYSGVGYSITYVENAKSVGVETTLTYQDAYGTTFEGLPKNIKSVGTYIARAEYTYNKDNYYNAPDSVEAKTATLTVSRRVYDAENLVTMKYYEADYTPGVDNKGLVSLKTPIPDWVSSNYTLTFYNSKGEEVTELINAGMYSYQWTFTFFDGIDHNATVKSKKGTFKVVGIPIKESDFNITYVDGGAGVYDGTTSFMPSATSYFDTSLDPYITLVYKFKKTGDTEYETVAEKDYATTSMLAGEHVFSYTFGAFNYEPKEKTITINVSRKPIRITRDGYRVANYEGYYDGADHKFGNLVLPTGEYDESKGTGYNPDYAYITYSAVILASNIASHDGLTGNQPGIDSGTYSYELQFACTNNNYEIDQDAAKYFDYTVKINEIDYFDATSKDAWSGYNVEYYDYDNTNANKYVSAGSIATTSTKTDISTITSTTSAFYLYAKSYLETDKTTKKEYLDIYEISGLDFSAYNFVMDLNTLYFSSTDETIKKYEDTYLNTLTNKAKYSVFYSSTSSSGSACLESATYEVLTQTMLDKNNSELSKGTGAYYVFISLCDYNLLFNGKSYICYKVTIDPFYFSLGSKSSSATGTLASLSYIGLADYKAGKTDLTPYTISSEIGYQLGSVGVLDYSTYLTNATEFGVFYATGIPSISKSASYDGRRIYFNLFGDEDDLDMQMCRLASSRCTYLYSAYQVPTSGQTILNSFNLKDGDPLLISSGDDNTQYGHYTICVTLPDGILLRSADGNTTYKNIVFELEIERIILQINDIINVKDTASNMYKYNTEMVNVRTASSEESTKLGVSSSVSVIEYTALPYGKIVDSSYETVDNYYFRNTAMNALQYSGTTGGYLASDTYGDYEGIIDIEDYFYYITGNQIEIGEKIGDVYTYGSKNTMYYLRTTNDDSYTCGYFYFVLSSNDNSIILQQTCNSNYADNDKYVLLFKIEPSTYYNYTYNYVGTYGGSVSGTVDLTTTLPTMIYNWSGATSYYYNYKADSKLAKLISSVEACSGYSLDLQIRDSKRYSVGEVSGLAKVTLSDAMYGGKVINNVVYTVEIAKKTIYLKSTYGAYFHGDAMTNYVKDQMAKAQCYYNGEDRTELIRDALIDLNAWGIKNLKNTFASDIADDVIDNLFTIAYKNDAKSKSCSVAIFGSYSVYPVFKFDTSGKYSEVIEIDKTSIMSSYEDSTYTFDGRVNDATYCTITISPSIIKYDDSKAVEFTYNGKEFFNNESSYNNVFIKIREASTTNSYAEFYKKLQDCNAYSMFMQIINSYVGSPTMQNSSGSTVTAVKDVGTYYVTISIGMDEYNITSGLDDYSTTSSCLYFGDLYNITESGSGTKHTATSNQDVSLKVKVIVNPYIIDLTNVEGLTYGDGGFCEFFYRKKVNLDIASVNNDEFTVLSQLDDLLHVNDLNTIFGGTGWCGTEDSTRIVNFFKGTETPYYYDRITTAGVTEIALEINSDNTIIYVYKGNRIDIESFDCYLTVVWLYDVQQFLENDNCSDASGELSSISSDYTQLNWVAYASDKAGYGGDVIYYYFNNSNFTFYSIATSTMEKDGVDFTIVYDTNENLFRIGYKATNSAKVGTYANVTISFELLNNNTSEVTKVAYILNVYIK